MWLPNTNSMVPMCMLHDEISTINRPAIMDPAGTSLLDLPPEIRVAMYELITRLRD